MTPVTRAQWGAREPRQVNRITVPTQHLVLHYFGTDSPGPEGVRAVQDFHMDTRGWHDIAYSLTADADNVYIGRGPGVRGAHTPQWNDRAHAVAAQVSGKAQPDGLLDRLAEAAVWLYEQGAVTEARYTGGHRDYDSTACPGNWLYARIPEINDRAQALLEGEDMAVKDVFRQAWDWAKAKGIATEHTKPEDLVSKQELMAFLHRYHSKADKIGSDGPSAEDVLEEAARRLRNG